MPDVIMIRQLLQLSRTMDKDAVMEKELFDLSAVCSDTLDGFSQAAEMKGIHLERAIQNGIFFTGDQTMMIRAVSNLIANAIKYNDPPGEVMILLEYGSFFSCQITLSTWSITPCLNLYFTPS